MDVNFDPKKRKRSYLRAVGPNEGAPASHNPDAWTGSSIPNFTSNFDDKVETAKESEVSNAGTDVGTTAEKVDRQIEETLRGPDDRPFEDRQH